MSVSDKMIEQTIRIVLNVD